MGWTGVYMNTKHMKMRDIRSFLEKETGCKIFSLKFGVAYGVINNDKIQNFLCVIMWRKLAGELMYKDMGEDESPRYYEVPMKYINQPCSIIKDTALNWRLKVREYMAFSSEHENFIRSLKNGDVFVYQGKKCTFSCFFGNKVAGYIEGDNYTRYRFIRKYIKRPEEGVENGIAC
jgi:hypothetical protein